MDERKKKILQCIQKLNEKQYFNKKQNKAKKKKLRKAKNHLLGMENTTEALKNDNRSGISDWESSFLRTNLIEAQETISKMTTEISRLKEALKDKEKDLENNKEVNERYKGRFKKLAIQTSFTTSSTSFNPP